MIQAEQQALFQTQNQEVLRIRQAELDYYMNFYGNFGTQAALMVGFVLNTLTNLIPNIETWHDQVFADLFFISTALSFIFGMHALLNSVFIVVFAPNLALHGPLGSMVRAVDGMTVEQNQVFFTFLVSMAMFAFSTAMCYYLIMRSS